MFSKSYDAADLAYVAADQQLVSMYSDFFYLFATLFTGIVMVLYWSYTHYFAQRLTMIALYRQANNSAKKAYDEFLQSKEIYIDHEFHPNLANHFYINHIENRIKLSQSMIELNDSFEALTVYLTNSEYMRFLPIFERICAYYDNPCVLVPIEKIAEAERAQLCFIRDFEKVGFISSALNRIKNCDHNCHSDKDDDV